MNARRPIVFVLLLLLLVLTQQMGFTHALSHWSAQRSGDAGQLTAQLTVQLTAQASEGDDSVKAQSFDQSCEQCLAFAQIGTPIDLHVYSFPASGDDASAVVAGPAQAECRRTVFVFHSRAPPVLA